MLVFRSNYKQDETRSSQREVEIGVFHPGQIQKCQSQRVLAVARGIARCCQALRPEISSSVTAILSPLIIGNFEFEMTGFV